VGSGSFQALLAPFLVDSYDLEARVFAAGIPARMLGEAHVDGVVPVGVLPGPLRKVLGVAQPLVRPADFTGRVVGLQDGRVATQTLEALGATPRAVPAETPLDGLDAYEQQISSIAGNSYDHDARYVTANLNLWPRPLVIVAGADLFATLSPEQQAALRDAGAAAVDEALAITTADEADSAATLCRRGLTFTTASGEDLAALRTAVEPVYASLAADAATKAHLDEIAALKQQVAAAADTSPCDASSSTAAAATIPDDRGSSPDATVDGVYRTSITREELESSPLLLDSGEINDMNWGDMTLTLADGRATWEQENDLAHFSSSGTYEVDGDVLRLAFTEGEVAGEQFAARWSLYRDTLTFARDDGLGVLPTPFLLEPWRRTDAAQAGSDAAVAAPTPIDGTWDLTIDAADFPDQPNLEEENYGAFHWVLDRGHFEMTQKNGRSDRWTRGSYRVTDDIVEFEVEDYGGTAPNNASEKPGEIFTFAWSLYRDKLALKPVPGAVSPDGLTKVPWTRAQ
jgi:hypothetical protein